jgi:hypothetical protein
MHKKQSLFGICLVVLLISGCREEKIIVPKPDSTLIGWVKRGDEFRKTRDTSHAGIQVWVDGLRGVTTASGRFQINLGQRSLVTQFACLDGGGSDSLKIPFSNIRLRYQGDFQEDVIIMDTLIYTRRSQTIIDSVYFSYYLDTLGPKVYQFLVQLNPSQDPMDRGANLRLGSSPAQAQALEFGQLLFQQADSNLLSFQFSDSIIAPGVGRFLPGSTVYFVANGTSANSSNTSFWRETSLFKMGLNRSSLQSGPIRQVVLP